MSINILVEPTELLNAGDTAMLQVAVARLREHWPDAKIHVFGDNKELVLKHCPGVFPEESRGRHLWFEECFLELRSFRTSPNSLETLLRRGEHYIRSRWPFLARLLLRFRLRGDHAARREIDHYLKCISRADLIFACGMGGLADDFPDFANELLGTMELGTRFGARTAMVGQGIGPLRNPALRRYAKHVLPHIDFISLREQKIGLPLLRSLGVSGDHLLVTGDDAIELAYHKRPEFLSGRLGINLRAAHYANLDGGIVEDVGKIVDDCARKYMTRLVAIPISLAPGESDADTISRLIGKTEASSAKIAEIDTPLKVIDQVRQCRVVVTGSYHAAVFALAMGIPSITLAHSTYYEHKFLGLQGQFGAGCQLVLLNHPRWREHLQAALELGWESAEQERSQLLSAARRQIELSRAAYERVYELCRTNGATID